MQSILVVEDEHMLAKIIGMKLGNEGFTVTHAQDGEEAYQYLTGGTQFDLVLLDVLLPKMSGFDVLERMKAENRPLPKVIVFSNFAQKADVERAHSLGAIDYIVKAAFSPAEIITKVRSVFAGTEVAAGDDDSSQLRTGPATGGQPTPYQAFESMDELKPMSEVLRPGEPNNNP
jgi:CheY-like chemotaxis protein